VTEGAITRMTVDNPRRAIARGAPG
jgi:hypothetical protein